MKYRFLYKRIQFFYIELEIFYIDLHTWMRIEINPVSLPYHPTCLLSIWAINIYRFIGFG